MDSVKSSGSVKTGFSELLFALMRFGVACCLSRQAFNIYQKSDLHKEMHFCYFSAKFLMNLVPSKKQRVNIVLEL